MKSKNSRRQRAYLATLCPNWQSRNSYVRTLHSAHYFAYLKGSVLITSPTKVKHKHSAKSSKVSLNFHLAISLTENRKSLLLQLAQHHFQQESCSICMRNAPFAPAQHAEAAGWKF